VPAGAPSVMPSASLMTDSLDFTPITNSSEQASWVPCTAAIRPRMNPSDPLRGARHSFRQPASGVIRGMLVSVDPSPVLMGVSASTRFTGRGERAIQKKEW
jgi:hypothetical protein